MIGGWRNLSSVSAFDDREFTFDIVLVEFNGPQVAVLRSSSGKRFLGVAADEDGQLVRWLLAEVTSLELAALSNGAVATADVLEKRAALVLDIPINGGGNALWQVAWDDVDPNNLPERGARLPAGARESLAEYAIHYESDEPKLVFAKAESKGKVVSLRALSQSLDVHQRLWTAIGQSIERSPSERGRWSKDLVARTELGFAYAEAASLKIAIAPVDTEIFTEIASKHTQLVLAGGDEDKLNFALSGMSDRVRNRYREFLVTVDKFELQVLSVSNGQPAFVNPVIARSALSVLPLAESSEVELINQVGYFELYGTEGAFTFRDLASDELIKGSVHLDVLHAHPSILVGPDGDYEVTIKRTVTSFQSQPPAHSFELVAVNSEGAAPMSPPMLSGMPRLRGDVESD
jgi:hypothetical protein